MKKATLLFIILFLLFAVLSSQNNMNIIAEFQGEHHTSGYGRSMTSLDFNHDGYIDLIVSSQFYGYLYGATPSRGKIYIYYGGQNFSSSTQASVTLEGTYNGTSGRQIMQVYNVGDINGDSFDDLCIRDRAPNYDADQRLMFFYGGINNLNNPDHIIYFPYYSYIGFVNVLSDINNDGYDDIGLNYRYNSGYPLTFSIIYGGNLNEEIFLSLPSANYSGIYIINGIGDINDDGFADFTTAYTNNDPNTGYHIINIYYGNSTGIYNNPQILIQTQEPITKVSKPLGDINGDGFDDFMGYTSNNGTHVWLGSSNINVNTPSFNLIPGWTGGETSQSLEHGDFNNDGYEDIVGATFYDRQFSVFLGRAAANGTSDLIIHQFLYENFGYGLTTGDYNADGFDDIAVSASHEDSPWPTGTFYGFVFVYGGNAGLSDTTVGNEDEVIPIPVNQYSLKVYPNPIRKDTEKLNLDFTGEGYKQINHAQLIICNIKGQTVYRQSLTNAVLIAGSISFTPDKLSSGVYLLSIKHNGTTLSTKKMSVISPFDW